MIPLSSIVSIVFLRVDHPCVAGKTGGQLGVLWRVYRTDRVLLLGPFDIFVFCHPVHLFDGSVSPKRQDDTESRFNGSFQIDVMSRLRLSLALQNAAQTEAKISEKIVYSRGIIYHVR